MRCGLEDFEKMGYRVYDLTEMASWLEDEDRWRLVDDHLTKGWFKPRTFYVYTAVGNTRLGRLIGRPGETEHHHFLDAWHVARSVGPIYEHVWVLTHQGGFEVYGIDVT